jgi:TonB family protein
MELSLRTEPRRLRRSFSFVASVCLHATWVAWVAVGSYLFPNQTPLYDREIRPNTARIVWYSLRDQLPAISPAEQPKLPQPPRALHPFSQPLVAGARDTNRPQLIWTPAPELDKPQLVPSPNLVALAPARPQARAFVPPQEPEKRALPSILPAAPEVKEAMANASNLLPPLQPARKTFVPPVEVHQPQPVPVSMPAAPDLSVAMANRTTASNLLPPLQPARKTFIPPVEAAHQPQPVSVNMPVAPELKVATADHATASNLLPPLQPARKTFVPPVEVHQPQPVDINLPTAPKVQQAATPEAQALPVPMAKPLKAFVAPQPKAPASTPPKPSLADAPQVSQAKRPSEASFAIASLVPTSTPEIPMPKASQQAGFSAGPTLRITGGEDTAQPGQLVIPGLLSRNNPSPGPNDPPPAIVAILAPPTSATNLGAAARTVKPSEPPGDVEVINAVRIAKPPDPRLEGRIVYSIAIQMPNITSFSGSWTVWFAGRDPAQAGLPEMLLKPPVPLRKVDPKYVPAAADDHVEGKVRLAAIIRKDGHVDAVELLRGLDNRLDRSAAEALSKWEFEPAQLNGSPIELDAIFDIPFHLAPRRNK